MLIKIFLLVVEEMDSRVHDQNSSPMWCAKSNFICLLNLPDTMRRYGPLRLLWEGGDCGEGVLCRMKPLVSGLTGTWQEASNL